MTQRRLPVRKTAALLAGANAVCLAPFALSLSKSIVANSLISFKVKVLRQVRHERFFGKLNSVAASAGLCAILFIALLPGGDVQSQALPDAAQLTAAAIDRLRMQADAGRDAHALALLQRAAAAGNRDAQRAYGAALLARSNGADTSRQALAWLQTAAQNDDATAQMLLAKAWFKGAPGIAPDHTQARRWFAGAAQNGDAAAAYYLGLFDRNGYAGAVDAEAAARWLGIAADAGIADAMFLLGNLYAAGEGVPQNQRAAIGWYMRAAALEHPLALQEVAMAFQSGKHGLPQSDLQAAQLMRGVEHALKHAKPAP